MKIVERRAEADLAFLKAHTRERLWFAETARTRRWITRHRAGVIVGGGFAAGFFTSLFPIAALMRLASAFAGTASLMLEGPFLRLLGAAHREATGRTQNPPTSTP